VDSRDVKNEKAIVMFTFSDYTDTLEGKIFIPQVQKNELLGLLSPGQFIKVYGNVCYDNFSKDIGLTRIKTIESIPDFRIKREDLHAEKRVELHCHTKMSDSDGVSDVCDIIDQAIRFGHKALAITDHGVVQSFTMAAHSKALAKHPDFKILYGCEGYLVDDSKEIVTDSKG
jgi:DNA polymerase-3 subunit alpha (Gram-positive type)